MDKPNFLGIGAARAGTTWLFRQLDRHPDVWMPRIKELHYFTRSNAYSGPSHLSTEGRLPRLLGIGPGPAKYRTHFVRALGSNILKPSWTKLRWDARYFFGEPGNDWYRSLFDDAGDKFAGEITPRYSVLKREDIARLRDDFPGIKVFYIMRDPVERTWSLIKYHEKRWQPGLASLPMDELVAEAFHPAKVEQSDYETVLANWRAEMPEEQFFTCFFDQVIEEPGALSQALCDFLGLSAPTWSAGEKKVNASSNKGIPDELYQTLVDYYRPMVERLSAAEGGYFTNWLERYDALSG